MQDNSDLLCINKKFNCLTTLLYAICQESYTFAKDKFEIWLTKHLLLEVLKMGFAP
jgi:hypothetical protein